MSKSPRIVSPFTRFLSLSSLFLVAFFLSVYDSSNQTSVKISLPLDRTVFQQSDLNNATFQIAGQVKYYFPSNLGYTPEYQIESLNKTGDFVSLQQSWTNAGIN